MSTCTYIHAQAEPLAVDAWTTHAGDVGLSLEWAGNAHEVNVFLSRQSAAQYAEKLEELARALRRAAEGEELEEAA